MATRNYGKLAGTAGAGGDFEPNPPGTYSCEVTAAEFRLAGTGSEMYVVEWTVEDGPHKNRKLWQNLVCKHDSAGSVSFFFGTMRTLGLDQEWFSENVGKVDDEDDDAVEAARATIVQALVGKRARVKTVHDTYKGKTKNEVKGLSAPSKAGKTHGDDELPGKPKKEKKAKKDKAVAAADDEKPAKPAKAPKKGKGDMPPGLG